MGESGRVARIQDGDLVYLDTGLAVRLVEIEAPRAGRNPDAFGEEARALLSRAALGRIARLYYGGLSRDRYDRALAHVLVEDEIGREVWLNGLMVRAGGARVRSFPDNAVRARRLLGLEDEARSNSRGLWALANYRVLGCADVLGPQGFCLVEGEVLTLQPAGSDSVARIRPQGMEVLLSERLREAPDALEVATGARLRVRGRVELDPVLGPAMRLTHWGQVEQVEG